MRSRASAHRAINALIILGVHIPWQALRAVFVVQMCAGGVDGGNCAGKSVFSGATVSSGAGRAQQIFIRMTQAEVVLGALVLATVSLFATWEPF
jgi:putative copper resistance protein D